MFLFGLEALFSTVSRVEALFYTVSRAHSSIVPSQPQYFAAIGSYSNKIHFQFFQLNVRAHEKILLC